MMPSNKTFGAQSMYAPLRRVMVRRPDRAFGNADPVRWHYSAKPELASAMREHDALVSMLITYGAEVNYHEKDLPDHADAIFVHDPVIVCNQGAIILKMGKDLRQGEESAIEQALKEEGVPIHARLIGDAKAEGGDLLWVDEFTLAVGIGFRTNLEGFKQLQAALPDVELIPVQLPYFQGPEACLHLMSTVSIVDRDLAVVYKPLTSVSFLLELERRGFGFVEVPENEFSSMGPNVLALGPRDCIMLEGNPETRSRMESAGCKVQTYRGTQISLIAEGGATCLTRSIWRG